MTTIREEATVLSNILLLLLIIITSTMYLFSFILVKQIQMQVLVVFMQENRKGITLKCSLVCEEIPVQ